MCSSDLDPLFQTSAVTVQEGTDGGTTPVTVTVQRVGETIGEATVDWNLTFPGSETTNESNNVTSTWYKAESLDIDGGDPTSGTLSFADGESSKTVTFNVVNDSLTESFREHFYLDLSNAVDGLNSDSAGVSGLYLRSDIVIIDDEGDPEITITADQATALEGTGTPNTFTYTISRSDLTDRENDPINDYPTTVYWSRPGNTNITFNGNRYIWNGYLTIPAGQANGTLTFGVFDGDDDIQSDIGDVPVTISLTEISTGSGPAKLSETSTATTRILDDDIRLWAEPVSVTEGNDGTTDLTFTVTRRGYLDTAVSFDYTLNTGLGTAENEDFTEIGRAHV